MYKTEDELDAEIEELRRSISSETLHEDNTESQQSDENVSEVNADTKLAETVRAMFDAKSSDDDIAIEIKDALQTAHRVFKSKLDTDDIMSQESKIKEIFGDFDIVNELKYNALFKRLLVNGVNVHTALLASCKTYADIITEDIKKEAKREYAENLRRGRERIMPQTQTGTMQPKTDVSGMSDAQFEEIEKKVKQNKRIFL